MRSKASPRNTSNFNGIVLWAAGGVYRVLLDNQQEVDAAMRGRLKLEERTGDRVVAGDRVCVELHDEDRSYAIEAIAPRRSELARRAPGRGAHQRAKVLVANVDQVVVMVAAARPDANLRMIDRFLILAEANDLPALLVVNKLDLADGDVAREKFRDYVNAGYDVLFTSVKEQIATEELSARLCGKESVLAGPSGVGKSSTLNLLQPGSELRTAEISDAALKGRHTTVGARLIPLSCGGYVVDTPGIREVGLLEVEPENLDICFPEFRALLGDCRFTTSCTHTHEPDCAIRDAVQSGTISHARYDSYRDLFSDLQAQSARY